MNFYIYELPKCQLTWENAQCIGETGRNGFSRGCEHWDNLDGKDEEKSILWRHSNTDHQAREDIVYTMKVTGRPG